MFKFRKTLSLVLLLCFMVTLLVPVTAFAKEKQSLSKNEISNLKKIGVPDKIIYDTTEYDVEMLNESGGTVVSKSVKYMKVYKDGKKEEITKEEYLLGKKQKGTTNDVSILSGGSDVEYSFLRLATYVTDQGNRKFTFQTSFYWDGDDPNVTLTDVVGTTHTDNMTPIQNSEVFKYTFDLYTTDPSSIFDTKNEYSYSADYKDVDGYAFDYDIKGSYNGYAVTGHRGYIKYDAEPITSSFTGIQGVYGHYSHQTVTTTFSVDLRGGSMSVSPSFAFVEATDTHATFTVD